MKHNLKLMVLAIVFCQLNSTAQILKGIGVYGALTTSRHTYVNKDAGKRDFTPIDFANNPNYYDTQNYISAERLSWGAGVFVELARGDRARWQTEASYTNKGSREKNLNNAFTGGRDGVSANKYTYIQWNNYLKFFNPMGYASFWYWMPGVRLEYMFKSAVTANTTYSGAFKKIWFSGDVGVGFEFPFIKKINWFTEYHWNPDIWNPKKNSTAFRNRTFEGRIGLVYRPKQKSIDDCNAPKYRGPAY